MKLLAFIFSLTLLVMTHEMGHLGFAKLFRTRVSRFYVFFNWGFSILKAKKFDGKWHFLFFNKETPESWDAKNLKPEDQNNTLWGLGWLPLGGYCDIAGMVDETKSADDLESTPQPWEYRSKKGWQKLCIISGGVLVNFISALLIYTAIFAHWGKDELPLRNATMGYDYHQVLLDGGFMNGDIVYALDGIEQTDYAKMQEYLLLERPSQVTVMRGDSLCTFSLDKAVYDRLMEDNPRSLMEVRFPFVIQGFAPGSVGERSGMQVGDSLVSIADIPTPTAAEFMILLPDYANDTVTIGFYREGEYHTQLVTLGHDGKLGIYAKPLTDIFQVVHQDYTLLEAIPAGISYGWNTLSQYVSSLKLLFTKSGYKSLGGFLTMGSLFPEEWNWQRFWDLTALLALVLAFMNIIPIPGLDGGHIMVTLYEMITRRKASEKALDILQRIGMAILFALLILANLNDVIRLFGL